MEQKKAISVKGIHKFYPSRRGGEPVHALRGVDLEVEQGTIYSVLGPNGAGKTTLISILTTLLFPDRGEGTVCGFDLLKERGRIREAVNVTSGNPSFTDTFTVLENLNYYGMLYGLPKALRRTRIDELVEAFDLETFRDVPFYRLSTGYKQRLGLAKSLINHPRILFLDEPTVGLDPHIAESIRIRLRETNRQEGLTIILTTHHMGEAEFLSDRIAFLRKGLIVAEGDPETLKRGIRSRDRIKIEYEGFPIEGSLLRSMEGVFEVKAGDHEVTVTVDDHQKRIDSLLRTFVSEPLRKIKDIKMMEPDLEDVFIQLAKAPD